MNRRYGLLCLLAPVCWTLTVALVLGAFLVGAYSVLLGASAVLTPSPTDEQDSTVALIVLVAVVVGALALGLVTLALDAAVTVVSVRRLGGDEHSSAVPVLCLVAVGVSLVAPALLAVLALVAGALEQPHIAAGFWWLLAGTMVALAPCARLAQLIGGIVETARASAPSPERGSQSASGLATCDGEAQRGRHGVSSACQSSPSQRTTPSP